MAKPKPKSYPERTFTSVQKAHPLAKGSRLNVGEAFWTVADVSNPSLRPSRLPFTYESYDHPAVAALRRALPVEKAVEGAEDDFERAVLLRNWVWRKGFSPEVTALWQAEAARPEVAEENLKQYGFALPLSDLNAVRVLRDNAPAGKHTIYCSHAAWAFMECASAVGLCARKININGHGTADVWCQELRKWVLVDPKRDYHFEKDGAPLSALEVRSEFFRNGGRDVLRSTGPEGKKSPGRDDSLPISLTPAGYEWFNILSRNDYLANPVNINDYWDNSRYLVLRDKHNQGQKWFNTRVNPPTIHEGHRGKFLFTRNPDDLFWDVHMSELRLTPSPLAGHVRVTVVGFAPNLKRREVSVDGGRWKPLGGSYQFFDWKLHGGRNEVRACALHKCGRPGPEAFVALQGHSGA